MAKKTGTIIVINMTQASEGSNTTPPPSSQDFPSKPTNLIATPGSDSSGPFVLLEWDEGTGGTDATLFHIQRATSSSGPFLEIGSQAPDSSNSFTDTTGIPGQTYFYLIAADDGTSLTNSTKTSATFPASEAPPPAELIRWAPGHYIRPGLSDTLGTSGDSGTTTILGKIKNYDYRVRGIVALRYWKFVETAKGVFDWDFFDAIADQCEAYEKTYVFRIQDRIVSSSTPTPSGALPSYLESETLTYVRPYPASTQAAGAALWLEDAMNYNIGVYEAILDRYGDRPGFVGIAGGESVFGNTNAWLTGGYPEYSASGYIDLEIARAQALRAHDARIAWWLYTNAITLDSASAAELQRLFAAARADPGIFCCGGPDMSSTDGWSIITGSSSFGGVDHRGLYAIVGSTESVEFGAGQTAAQIYSLAVTTRKSNYMSWSTAPSQWASDAYSFITSHPTITAIPDQLVGMVEEIPEATPTGQWPAQTSTLLPIFIGIAGYGTTTVAGSGRSASVRGSTGNAGSGTTIIHVTNTNNSGAGSLVAALATSGNREIVFDVSGVMTLTGDVLISSGNCTVRGQTAPSPGFTVLNGAFTFVGGSSNTAIQHLTIRCGDLAPYGARDNNRASIKVDCSGSGGSTGSLVFKNCTFGWGTDEILDIFLGWDNVHFQFCIVADGLFENSIYNNEGSGFGSLCTNSSGAHASFYGCLFAHLNERFGQFYNEHAVFVNNLLYDAAKNMSRTGLNVGDTTTAFKHAYVGNVFMEGPSWTIDPTPPSRPDSFDGHYGVTGIMIDNNPALPSTARIYLADNARLTGPNSHTATVAPLSDQWDGGLIVYNGTPAITAGDPRRATSAASWPNGMVAAPVGNVRSLVLATAGSRPADRNARDAQLVRDVINRTGRLWSTVAQYGGYPSNVINHRTYTSHPIPSNPNQIVSGSGTYGGYTAFEQWAHEEELGVM